MKRTIGILIVTLLFTGSVVPVSAETDPVIEQLMQRILELERQLEEHGVDIRSIELPEEVEENDTPLNEEESINDEEEDSSSTIQNDADQLPEEEPENVNDHADQASRCLEIDRTLRHGMTGEDIRELQEFLQEEGHFVHPAITNYFGPVTEGAIQEFQTAQGIVSHGAPSTTGFGQVGPLTRAALSRETCSG